MDTSWNTRNSFSTSKGDRLLKQPERRWKLHPRTWLWASRRKSALCWAGVCTGQLVTCVVERHWMYSHRLHLLNNLKYVSNKSYSLVSDEHNFSTYFLCRKEFHIQFYSLITSPREQKLGLRTATPKLVHTSILWEVNPGGN